MRRSGPTGTPAMASVVALVLGLIAALASCGLPAEPEATPTPPSDVPFRLLDPTATTPQGSAPPSDTAGIQIFLVSPDGQHVVAVARDAATNREVADVVATLVQGPTPAEATAGLSSALPSGDVIISAQVSGGVAAVDLRATFADVAGRDQLLAIAQLVYTLTAQPGIGRVVFTVEGADIDVPRGDGSLTSGSVSRDAYAPLTVPPSA